MLLKRKLKKDALEAFNKAQEEFKKTKYEKKEWQPPSSKEQSMVAILFHCIDLTSLHYSAPVAKAFSCCLQTRCEIQIWILLMLSAGSRS